MRFPLLLAITLKLLTSLQTPFSLTLLALPESIALGMLAAAPFGLAWAPIGVLSGLVAYMVYNFVHASLRGNKLLNSGAYSLSSIMLASMATLIIHAVDSSANTSDLIVLWFIAIALSGVFQMMFGAFQLGFIAKYIPYPVLSGLINGTVIWIILSQLPILLGMPVGESLLTFEASQINHFNSTILLVLVLVYLALGKSALKSQRDIIVLVLGLVLFNTPYFVTSSFFLDQASYSEPLSDVQPLLMQLKESLVSFSWWQHKDILITLLPNILGLSLVLSLRTMLNILMIDELQGKRSNVSKELVKQGLGNLFSAMCGGINSSGSTARIMLLHHNNLHLIYPNQISSLMMLILVWPLGGFLSYLPLSLLALLLMLTALKSFDVWSIQLVVELKTAVQKSLNYRHLLGHMLVVVSVTLAMVFVDIFAALAYGLSISILIVIYQMSKSVIRRQYSLQTIRANIQRPLNDIQVLEKVGMDARVFELEGALFFGTADRLAVEIDRALKQSIRYICLDLNRVLEIDATGFKILKRINSQCQQLGINLTVSINPKHKYKHLFEEQKSNVITVFENFDDCLVWIESELLKGQCTEGAHDLGAFFNNLGMSEIETLSQYWEQLIFLEKDYVFRQGDEDESVYLILEGRIEVSVHNVQAGNSMRITTLCSGTVFGEMSLFDQQTRSADIQVTSKQLVCLQMTLQAYQRLMEEHADIAFKVMQRMSREISERVRTLNNMLKILK